MLNRGTEGNIIRSHNAGCQRAVQVLLFLMESPPFGFLGIKVIALAVNDVDRANMFYGTKLGLPPAFEGDEQVGYLLGHTVLMLKANWYATPTDAPNPRITIATENALETEKSLRNLGIVICDPVALYDEFYVGSFLDSEGNKLWFCSPEKPAA